MESVYKCYTFNGVHIILATQLLLEHSWNITMQKMQVVQYASNMTISYNLFIKHTSTLDMIEFCLFSKSPYPNILFAQESYRDFEVNSLHGNTVLVQSNPQTRKIIF